MYRQLKNWRRLGWASSESTLFRLVIHGSKILQLLTELLHAELLKAPYLQGDETVVQVLREPHNKKQPLNQEWGSCGSRKPYSAKEYTMRINLIGQLNLGKSFMLNLLVCCSATAILFMRPLTVAIESVVWLMFTGSFLKRPKEIAEPKDR